MSLTDSIKRAFYDVAVERVIKKHPEWTKEDIERKAGFEESEKCIKIDNDRIKFDNWKMPTQSSHVYSQRKSSYRTGEDSKRCMARICNDWYGGQCKSKAKEGDLCGRHINVVKSHGKLLFSRINKPREINLPEKEMQQKRWRNTPEEENRYSKLSY